MKPAHLFKIGGCTIVSSRIIRALYAGFAGTRMGKEIVLGLAVVRARWSQTVDLASYFTPTSALTKASPAPHLFILHTVAWKIKVRSRTSHWFRSHRMMQNASSHSGAEITDEPTALSITHHNARARSHTSAHDSPRPGGVVVEGEIQALTSRHPAQSRSALIHAIGTEHTGMHVVSICPCTPRTI
jgi:hypothetical protein